MASVGGGGGRYDSWQWLWFSLVSDVDAAQHVNAGTSQTRVQCAAAPRRAVALCMSECVGFNVPLDT